MAKQLTNDKVLMGNVLPVQNLKQKFGENTNYLAVKTEDESGIHEEWLLFTKKELERTVLDIGGLTVLMKPGRVYHYNVGKRKSFIVKLVFNGCPQTVVIGRSIIERARKRAGRNPEDIPRQSKLADMLD